MKSYLLSCLNKIKADYAEIRYEETTTTYIHFIGRELEAIGISREKGGNVRVKGKCGWSFLSFNDLDTLPSYLTQIARYSHFPQNGKIELAPVPPVVEIIPGFARKDPRKIDLAEKQRLCEYYNRLLLTGPEIQTSDLKYVDTHTVKYFANSEGSYIVQERFYTLLGMVSIARRGNNIQSAHEGVGGVGGYELVENQEEKAERAAKRASDLLDAEPATGGKYTVIVDPELSGVFAHEAFGHLSEADFLFENERLLEIMKLGRQFGGEFLNIVDEPGIQGEGGFYLYDDEGVPAGKTY
ncbi:TldD/PmbA family protein, partial [Candidatus Aerophobetes bacterium]|nr:TldD/PmbA family protein [Candidatus Aerophobetes bacterium]